MNYLFLNPLFKGISFFEPSFLNFFLKLSFFKAFFKLSFLGGLIFFFFLIFQPAF
ncbi:hypothetical protein HPIN_04550 [Helicobacter pylori India7]|uniref:Uncharacterized protein n=1 Tax=Helicobacter pylori (strain India7) TaxID=907238 RepID=E8QGL8_HELP7|nr:hypothetical protein HPIN_04550 [Helicobacter pylori India7]